MAEEQNINPAAIYCVQCGHLNTGTQTICESCSTPLRIAPTKKISYHQDRPGCVTVYAVLQFITAGLAVIAGFLYVYDEPLFLVGAIFIAT